MRNVLAGWGLAVVVAACAGSGLSMAEYGDRLNEIVGTYGPEAEAAWVEFGALSAPTLEDLKTLFERDVATRIGVEAAFRELDPPGEIADLHGLLVEWLTALTDADAALTAQLAVFSSWDQFLDSAEYRRFEETLLAGAEVCTEFQARLDATAARGVFAETPWMPNDLKEVVDAVIGCEAIPADLDPVFTK